MTLTLAQFLHLILTLAAVVAAVFLVMLLIQLRKTAREAEKSLVGFRELAENLNATNQKVSEKIDDLGSVFESTCKAATGISQASMFFSNKLMRPSARYWPLIFPILRLVMQYRKKKKEAKDG